MALLSPLSTQVSVRNMQVVDDVCRSAFGCGGVDLAAVALVTLVGLLAILVAAAFVHVTEAASILEEEQARLRAERDAFDDFSRRVATLDAVETATVPAAGGLATATSAGTSDRLVGIQRAYRDTVMAVDHFEEDYDEPLAENMAAEFGDDLAYAVTQADQLTPQLKSALLSASREASQRRTSFLSTLAAEEAAIAEAADVLAEIDDERARIAAAPSCQRSWDALVDDWNRLGELADRCREQLRLRQERNRARAVGVSTDLQEYLYAGLPVDHPVMADLVELSTRIERRRSDVLKALTRRV